MGIRAPSEVNLKLFEKKRLAAELWRAHHVIMAGNVPFQTFFVWGKIIHTWGICIAMFENNREHMGTA